MKKLLVTLLALVFVLGIAGVALADVNPFSDVPDGHWAYAAVAQLAADGLIDGYDDGTFRGDHLMTRYEMAQVVAKAMAREDQASAADQATIDKLSVEFASELNNLGVRVTKLETKTNIAFTYESRIRFTDDSNKPIGGYDQGSNAFDFRQRINIAGPVNDKTTFGARLVTINTNGLSSDAVDFGSGSAASVGFDRLYFTFNNCLFDQTTIGRFSTNGITEGLLNSRTNNNDGIKFNTMIGDGAKFTGAFYDVKPDYGTTPTYTGTNEVGFAGIDFKLGDSSHLNFGYQTDHFSYLSSSWPIAGMTSENLEDRSYDIGAYTMLGNCYLTGEYVTSKSRNNYGLYGQGVAAASNPKSGDAYVIQLTNGITPLLYPINPNIVDPTKPHTDAFALSYRYIEQGAVPYTSCFRGADAFATATTGGAYNSLAQDDNVKGCYVAYQNVLSKGVIWTVDFQGLKQIVGTGKDNIYTSSFQFFF